MNAEFSGREDREDESKVHWRFDESVKRMVTHGEADKNPSNYLSRCGSDFYMYYF